MEKTEKENNEYNRNHYKKMRNDYVSIRREEEIKFEKDVVGKCKDDPKLFYRYVNGKMTYKDTTVKLIKEKRIYDTEEEMSELMNESFKSVFTREEEFEEPNKERRLEGLREIRVEKKEIMKLLEELDVRKAMGPDGVSNWTLRECKDQLVEPIWDVINSSLKEGIVPREWKRANTQEPNLHIFPVPLCCVCLW